MADNIIHIVMFCVRCPLLESGRFFETYTKKDTWCVQTQVANGSSE